MVFGNISRDIKLIVNDEVGSHPDVVEYIDVKYHCKTIQRSGNIICKLSGFKSIVERLSIVRGDVVLFKKKTNDVFYVYNDEDFGGVVLDELHDSRNGYYDESNNYDESN